MAALSRAPRFPPVNGAISTLPRGGPRPGPPAPKSSLTDPAVDALPEEIGVAVVPGVLLDHVDQHLAQGQAAVPDVAQVVDRVDVVLGEGDLRPPRLEGVLHQVRVADGGGEGEVPIV